MSACCGTKRTSQHPQPMSAFGGKADILSCLLLTQSGHQRCCAPSHLASQIQQHTRPQRQRDQNADRHVIKSMHGVARPAHSSQTSPSLTYCSRTLSSHGRPSGLLIWINWEAFDPKRSGHDSTAFIAIVLWHGAAFGRLFDLTQTRLADVPFILRPLRGCRARRLDHLRDIWRSCVSAPVAGSNTMEG